MARVPDGAELIQSATILAPGFKLGNVIVMAGIPTIMQAMMDIVAPKLKSGVRMLSDSVRANAREGDIGGPLARDRQRPSRHHHRQLSVPGRRQEAEHQSRGPLARSRQARRRDGCGEGDAGGFEHAAIAPMISTRPIRADDLELVCRHREQMFRESDAPGRTEEILETSDRAFSALAGQAPR